MPRNERRARLYTALASSPLRRAECPTTVTDLARRLKVDHSTLHNCLLHGEIPRRGILARSMSDDAVAAVLGIPAASLLDGGPCPCCGCADTGRVVALLDALADDARKLGGLPIGELLLGQINDLRRLVYPASGVV